MKKTIVSLTAFLLILILPACSYKQDANPSPSGKGGSLARFAIAGNVMYFVDHSQIKVFDVTRAEQPTLVRTVGIQSNTVETIYQHGSYLYLGSSNGMYIYNISDPTSPTYVSMATHVMGCDPVVSDGLYAYVTVRNTIACNRTRSINVLEIYNVSNPQYPQKISTTNLVAPIGLALDGDRLFVCDDSLKVFDISSRVSPKKIKAIASKAVDIIINGDNILTIDPDGINQYSYDRTTLEIIHRSKIYIPHK